MKTWERILGQIFPFLGALFWVWNCSGVLIREKVFVALKAVLWWEIIFALKIHI